MKRIAIYVRVSTEEQARGKNNSLDSQEHRCRQYLETYDDNERPEEVGVYRDEGFSGKDMDRPAFQKMMADVRSGIIDTIVFTELSRVSRNVGQFLQLVEEFEKAGVEFISLREKFDTTTPHGKLIMTILMALNQFEREQTVLRTRLTMRSKAERGLWAGGHFPVGLVPVPEKKGHLQVDPEGAAVVKALFETYVETGSIAATIDSLEERGIRRPATITAEGLHRPAKRLTDGAVRNILRNPSFIGVKEINPRNRDLTEEAMSQLPEVDRYRTVKAVWPPVIEEDLFHRANAILRRNAQSPRCSIRKKEHDYILAGLIHCHDCDRLLEVESAKSNSVFYYRHPVGLDTSHCTRKRWRAEVVEQAVIDRLQRLGDDEALFDLVQKTADEALRREEPELLKALKGAQARLDRLESERSNLVRILSQSEGDVPASFWSEARKKDDEVQRARQQVQEKESELAVVRGRKADSEPLRESLRNIDQLFHELPMDEKRRFLHAVIDYVAVKGDNSISMFLVHEAQRWNKALGINRASSKFPETVSWLRRRDLNPRPSG